ncbi:MAG: signal recognition particle-docking protein FtsY [Alcaligenaceae bacterium]|nr:signal recognition particle-docking protein FtsY [Alcaligenaceae bacterium]
MFRFFRRKKSKEENKVSQEPAADLAVESVEETTAVEVVEPAEEVVAEEQVVEAQEQPEPEIVVEVEPKSEPEVIVEVEPEPEVVVEAEPESEPEPEVVVEVEAEPAVVVETEPEPEPEPVVEEAPKASWMQRLRKRLSRTGSNIGALFVGVKVDEELFEELETALLMADAGVEATESLLSKLRTRVKQQRIEDAEQVKVALKELLTEHLKPLEKSFMLPLDGTSVVMIAGVNGAGKTTSIGKLAHHFQASGASVLLAAGDTFRAAAREQLVEWGKRNNVAVISQDGGDPAAVAFDAVNAGKARQANVVMIDTAGRLPTQLHLMEELKKIKRVINKADNEAPHEVLLVVDGNTGQNVITQIKTFDAALGLTGLVVTKLDGTAKGGTLAAVAAGSQGVRPVPVYWIGVGESLHDLQPFSAEEFASALLG